MSRFKMLDQHLPAVTNWQVAPFLLPSPNLGLGLPPRVLIQLVVGIRIRTVDHIQIADVQSPLLKDVKKLQAACAFLASGQTKIQAVPICVALYLGTI